MKKLAILALVALFAIGCSDDDPQQTVDDSEVKGSVETLEGRTYHCFRYVSIDRGGLWCQEVES